MAAPGDIDMIDRNKPAIPARTERLIDEMNPLRDFFASLPGFHTEIKVTEKKDEAKFLDLQKLKATTELLKTKFAQYDYSIEIVKDRIKERGTIDAKITNQMATHKAKMEAEEKKHQQTMYKLRRKKQFLTQLEQIDDNLFIINAEIEETEKNLNAKEYKEAKRQRLAMARHERNDAYEEVVAAQNKRPRRIAPHGRRSPSMPFLVPDDQEQVDEEYEAPFSAASA